MPRFKLGHFTSPGNMRERQNGLAGTYGCWAEAESWLRREAGPRTVLVGFSLAGMQPLHWGGKEKKNGKKESQEKNQLLG